MSAPTFDILATGPWAVHDITVAAVPSGRPVIAAVEARIDAAWWAAAAKLGDKLFDGPMCRLESWHVDANRLHLELSSTSYRPFLGTNLSHPELADAYGHAALANPVGVSTALATADGFLLLGLRGGGVAYYPHRIHPFAGSLEPDEATPAGVFAAPLRELREELHIEPHEAAGLTCLGLARDRTIRQPELVFACHTSLTRDAVRDRLDPAEHDGLISFPATPAEVGRWMADPRLTPVAAATLRLWRDAAFGPPAAL